MNDEPQMPAATPCARCAQPIGGEPWKMVEGRVYHQGCEANEYGPTGLRKVTGLGEHAERAARNVLHGKDQPTLEEQ